MQRLVLSAKRATVPVRPCADAIDFNICFQLSLYFVPSSKLPNNRLANNIVLFSILIPVLRSRSCKFTSVLLLMFFI